MILIKKLSLRILTFIFKLLDKKDSVLIISNNEEDINILKLKLNHYFSKISKLKVIKNFHFYSILRYQYIFSLEKTASPLVFNIIRLKKDCFYELNLKTDPWISWKISNIAYAAYLKQIKKSETNFIAPFASKFKELRTNSNKFERVYLLGTGPSISNYDFETFNDGIVIACNSIIKNRDEVNKINNLIVVATDAVLYFGVTKITELFFYDLNKTLSKGKFVYFCYPANFHTVVLRYIENKHLDKLIPIPRKNDRSILILKKKFELCDIGNTLNTIMLPIGCSLSKNIYLCGFDGQNSSNDNSDKIVWEHSHKFNYDGYLEDVSIYDKPFIDFHKSKTKLNKYTDTYHGEELDEQLKEAEKIGYYFCMMHPSNTPVLNKRHFQNSN